MVPAFVAVQPSHHLQQPEAVVEGEDTGKISYTLLRAQQPLQWELEVRQLLGPPEVLVRHQRLTSCAPEPEVRAD